MYVKRTLLQIPRGVIIGQHQQGNLMNNNNQSVVLKNTQRNFQVVTAEDLVNQKAFRGYAPSSIEKENRIKYRFARLRLKNIIQEKTPRKPFFYEEILEQTYLRDLQVSYGMLFYLNTGWIDI